MFVAIIILSLAAFAVSSEVSSNATTLLPEETSEKEEVISITQAPYQVSLRRGSGHFCGGIILSDRYILTAARCVYNITPETTITVHAGSADLSVDNQVARVVQINIHPNYNFTSHYRDLAILQINPVLRLGSSYNAEAANLRGVQSGMSSDALTVTGWGTTSLGVKPGLLQSSRFEGLGWDDNCKDLYGDIPGSWICANACVGNAGDPIRADDGDDAGYVVGIVSFQPEDCGNENAYIYTWIEYAQNYNFITQVTGL